MPTSRSTRRPKVTPGVVVYRYEDRVFFANARYLKARVSEAIRAAPWEVSWLVFDAEAVTHMDTGLEALADLGRDLERDRIVIVLARLRARIEEQLDLVALKEVIGRHHSYPSVHATVDGYAHDREAVTA